MTALAAAIAGTLVLNLPFGFWRAGQKKFSVAWFVAIHAPVPFVVLLRMALGIQWHSGTFLLLIGAYFVGQHLGGRLRR